MPPLKILLIDDSKVFWMHLRRSLEKTGLSFEFEGKLDKESGIKASQNNTYDCIFLDYLLPDGDGLSVLKEIRAAGIKTPVIVLTGYGDETLAVQMMKAGASDYISKSAISPGGLAKSIHGAIRNYSLIIQAAQSERALTEAKEFFERVVSTAKVLIIGLDPDCKIQLFNIHSEEFFDWKKEEAIGKDWLTYFIPKSHRFENENLIKRLFGLENGFTRQGIRYEGPVLTRAGDERIIAWNNTVLRNHKNEVSMIIWTGVDITDRKKAEEALRKSEELFRATFAGAAIGILLSDQSGLVFKSNTTFQEMLGYSDEELCRMTIFDLTHTEYIDNEKSLYQEVLKGKRNHFQMEKRYVRKDGSFVWGRLNVSPILDGGGRPLFAIGMVEDVTERKLTEEVLQKRLAYERMTSEISLLGVMVENIDEFQQKCLEIMGNLLDVSEIHIFEYNHKKELFINTFSWTSPDMDSKPDRCHSVPSGNIPWLMQMIKDNRIINYKDIENIPGESEKEISRLLEIKSVLMLPVYIAKRFYGLIIFNECRYHRKWPEEDVALLNTIVQIISGAIERKQSENALRKSEAKYRSYFENSQDIVFITSGDSFVDINPAATKLSGLTREELLKINIGDLYHSAEVRRKLREELFLKGYIKDFPADMRTKDGSLFNGLITAVLVAGEGSQNETYGIIRDITEHRKAEAALSQEKERLSVTLRSIGEGVITTDVDKRIVLVNRVAEDILGWSQEELKGKSLSKAFNSEDLDRKDKRTIPEEGSLSVCGSMAITARDGKTKLISRCTSLIKDRKEDIIGYVIVFRDITEQRRMEEQAALSQKMESIGRLAAGIAHEINTPMQYIGDNTKFMEDSFKSILDYMESCKKIILSLEKDQACATMDRLKELVDEYDIKYLVEEVPKAIEQTLEGIERVSKLVLAMKEFTHPGKKEKVFSDINKAIYNTVIISKNEWKYVADLKTDLDQSLPLICCDIDQINQVILNMLVNAAQAIRPVIVEDSSQKGEILIKTRTQEDYIEIVISDTGEGIPEAVLNKIFDPFFTTKEVGKGTGQGLAFAHDIIANKHKGSIFVESELGTGTKFTIRLPVKASGE